MKMKCSICGWIYDEAEGLPNEDIEPGTTWEVVSEDFRCPQCGAMKKWFQQID